MRKVFLDDLPRKNRAGKECIDWIKSVGYKVRFIYDDVQGFIKILHYKKENKKLFIEYNNKKYDINTARFKYCNLEKILNKKTKNFKVEIGQTFKDDKRDITISDEEYRKTKRRKIWN